VQEVDMLRERLGGAAAVILTDYRGLNVGEISQLRQKLRESGVEYKVVKNTLLQRAAQEIGVEGLSPHLQGPTAVAFSRRDPVAPAKILLDYIRQMRKLEIKAGLIEGRLMTTDQIKRLADLPAKAQLLAVALGAMKAPLTGLVGALAGLPRSVVYALDQIRRQKEAAAQ
jgi:large subunit ribosomal protein L10